ncbi:GntR family transcriptional regulator [Algihabitans albus]|uniref:GntR family transcriptional regulator n=1 Tax=Algihabitans albus TaxID=2164067 RepID=UPI000E5CAD57|nr:GntR family transcriptional regulator [Algihabitans albus]
MSEPTAGEQTTELRAVTPIARRSLHDELVARLRNMIVEGELRPGARLPEKELCSQFGVSRTPLREALKVLASDGLVEISPHRGATVVQISRGDVEEMFPVMGALEALAGELACANIDAAGVAEITALHHQMVAHYHRKERAEYFRLNQQIHERILEAAGNATLTALHGGLAGRVRRARFMANMSPPRWQQAVEEHEQILAALTARDGAGLADILRRHLAHKAEVVIANMTAAETETETETHTPAESVAG